MRSFVLLVVLLGARAAEATVYTVAQSGGDFTTIQAALDAAFAGDTIQLREKPTPYLEKLVFPRSGSAGAGYITLEAFPGEQPVVDGTGVPGDNMVLIENRSYVRVIGLELRNNLGVTDGSGVRILGAGSHIEVRDNRIHDMRGANAMGITVYATEPQPISDLIIDGNEIYDSEPAPSEALTLNGNVDGFAVTNNVVRDVNNIGIDFIGGETDIQSDPSKVARNGVCRGNHVTRARSIYGGGFAGGIYVDGGRDIVIERNVVTESDLGLEVGAENPGIVTRNIAVRDNVIYANEKVCIVFGGFQSSVGRVRDSSFTNNTCYRNDTLAAGFGELWIQYAEDNAVRNNVFYATAQNLLLVSEGGSVNNDLDYNLWFADAGPAAARFSLNGTSYTGFATWQAGSGEDANSLFADPLLVAPGALDFHLAPTSPAINAGDPAFVAGAGETDLDGAARVSGPRVDIGADEVTCGDNVTNPGEECDDGDLIDGDGCDSNCTVTACGNRVVTAGEQCDDGNLAGGDCCSAACQLEANGAPCDDSDPCTTVDACSAGACTGAEVPASGCKRAGGAASFDIRDRGPDVEKNSVAWKWQKGAATNPGDLGDPIGGTTGYVLCVYDTQAGVSHTALRARMPAGGLCKGRPCWRPLGTSGLRYDDRDLTPDGVKSVKIKTGPAGKASIGLKAKGDRLTLPDLPLVQDPSVTVQLRNDAGACWETVHGAPALKNQPDRFLDK
jgi:cysteine-rich repeat protein